MSYGQLDWEPKKSEHAEKRLKTGVGTTLNYNKMKTSLKTKKVEALSPIIPKSASLGDKTIKAINELDLGPIKYKLVHEKDLPLSEVREMEKQYRQFLTLIHLYPVISIVPTEKIDKIWHAHILDTQKYREDCDKIFGKFIDHFPYLGLRGPEDAELLDKSFDKTAELFLKEFSEPIFGASACEGTECGGTACGSTNCDGGEKCNPFSPGSENQVLIRPTLD